MDEPPNADARPTPTRSLCIALPMYGPVETGFFLACMKLTHVLAQEGIEHTLLPLRGESHITRARNRLVHRYLTRHAETDLLFLDCDLEFDPATIVRLVRSGFDVAAAPYPTKSLPSRLVCNVLEEDRRAMATRPNSPDTDGFVRAYDVPTGCLLIRRRVFERLREIVGTYRDDVEPDPAKRELVAMYFDDGLEDGSRPDGRWLSEDYWFTRLVQLAGFEAYLDTRAKLAHIGKLAYRCPSLEEEWAAEAKEASDRLYPEGT